MMPSLFTTGTIGTPQSEKDTGLIIPCPWKHENSVSTLVRRERELSEPWKMRLLTWIIMQSDGSTLDVPQLLLKDVTVTLQHFVNVWIWSSMNSVEVLPVKSESADPVTAHEQWTWPGDDKEIEPGFLLSMFDACPSQLV